VKLTGRNRVHHPNCRFAGLARSIHLHAAHDFGGQRVEAIHQLEICRQYDKDQAQALQGLRVGRTLLSDNGRNSSHGLADGECPPHTWACDLSPVVYHGSVPTRAPAQIKILQAEHVEKYPWLLHGFSTRQGGSSRVYGGHALNLGFTKADTKVAVERNRAAFLAHSGANGRQAWPLVTLRQVHSDIIHRITTPPSAPLFGDGMVTDTPGIVLAIQTADCLPVILVDPKKHAVGVFHAGWRGTVKRIVEKGVGVMRLQFGSRPRDLQAAMGTGVHNCCYTVGEEVRDRFIFAVRLRGSPVPRNQESDPVREKYPLLFLTARAPGHRNLPVNIFLDLVEANRLQLLDAGVSARRIAAIPFCSACNTDLLFSHRTEKGNTGRLLGVAAIRPQIARGQESGVKSGVKK
jgi:YfiH family protein